MTPLARVEAAILRLETERDAVSDIEFKKFLYFVGGTPSPFEALTLTLHSTVDVQLAIMREPLAVYARWGIPGTVLLEKYSLAYALADAINAGSTP